MRVVLASASPRRRMLLAQAGIEFEQIVCGADESFAGAANPCEAVMTVAKRKAFCAAQEIGDGEPAYIIAADTTVCVDGRILEKPRDGAEAFEMLSLLQGKKHAVHTGVCMINTATGEEAVFADTASVFMRALTDSEINDYIATGEPFDKAGAYGIQGKGALLVERTEGDYNTVVGLPLVRVYLILRGWGVKIFFDGANGFK
ncbi:MAG: Maf family protein [Defluviitaleaceae bacterium]|nr:Maf family protein [Defluviitaleaceae bacterium]